MGLLTRLSPRVFYAVVAAGLGGSECPAVSAAPAVGPSRNAQGDGAGLFCAVISAGLNGVADEGEVQGMLYYSASSTTLGGVLRPGAGFPPRTATDTALCQHGPRRPAAGTSTPVRGMPYKRGGGGLVVAVASAEKNMGRQGWAEAASVVGP